MHHLICWKVAAQTQHISWFVLPRVLNNAACTQRLHSHMHHAAAVIISLSCNKKRCQASFFKFIFSNDITHPYFSNMASGRVPEREVREESRRAATANPPDFSIHRYSLLIITGRTAHLEHTGPISRDIERGTSSRLHGNASRGCRFPFLNIYM